MTIAPQWIKDLYLQVADELCDGKEWCWHGTGEPLQRFAALVAAHEREACAKLCETTEDCNPHYAAAIRARSESAAQAEARKALAAARAAEAAATRAARDARTAAKKELENDQANYHIETGACIQHGEWARTAGLGCPACNGEIEKYKE